MPPATKSSRKSSSAPPPLESSTPSPIRKNASSGGDPKAASKPNKCTPTSASAAPGPCAATAFGGKPFTVRGEYRSIDPPRLLEFTWLADWHENEPQMVIRFDLTEKDGHTTVRLTHRGFTHPQTREQYQGWPWLLKMLQGYCEPKTSSEKR
jgi:uncharacterized protein YndB with AHSA1/START domain